MRITDLHFLKNLHLQTISNAGLDVMKCEKVQGMQELAQSDINKVRDEKLKLKAVVADLTQVNRRWQRYNNDMQIYIKKLHSTIEDQQEQLNNMADRKAEKVLSQTTQENEEGSDSCCKKCRPVIEYLKFKVTSLEEELSTLTPREKQKQVCSHCSQRIQDSTSEILSLKCRLEQACKHIDYLNSLMVSKGVLKTGYNLLPDPHSCHLDEKLRSIDGLNFYECDGTSDLATTSTEGGHYKSSETSSWETTDDADQASLHLITSKGGSEDFNSVPSLSHSDTSNEECKEFQTAQKIKELSLSMMSKDLEKEVRDTNSIKLPPDRFNDEGQSTSSTDLSKSTLKDNPNRYFNPLNDSSIKSNHLMLSTSSSSGSSKLSPPLDIYHIDPSPYELIIGLSLSPPLFCPHCHTVFPPDANASYNKHILSCELS